VTQSGADEGTDLSLSLHLPTLPLFISLTLPSLFCRSSGAEEDLVDQRQIWCWDPGVGVDLGDTVMGAWRAAGVGVDLALGLGLGSPVGSETGSPVGSGFFLFF
jgi:hypothetical protein